MSVSHELRNPISCLLGSLTLALQEDLPKPVIELIKTSKMCGDLLLQLINNILDSGKAEIGTLEVQPTSTHLRDLLYKVWAISRELLRDKGISGYVRIDKSLPSRIMIDAYRLNQILLNLIGNAIKFTRQGSITVQVKWLKDQTKVTDESFLPLPYESDDIEEGIFERDQNLISYHNGREELLGTNAFVLSPRNLASVEREEKGILKIIVQDTGCGMSQQSLLKLFQKFSQV